MTKAATFMVAAYGIMLLLVGIGGVFTAEWELRQLYNVRFGDAPSDRATFLNQYRFLKGVEMGAGAFCLLLLRAIMDGGKAAGAFVLLLAGGIFARSFAWAVDGEPAWPMLLFLALEVVVLAIYLLHLRHRRAR